MTYVSSGHSFPWDHRIEETFYVEPLMLPEVYTFGNETMDITSLASPGPFKPPPLVSVIITDRWDNEIFRGSPELLTIRLNGGGTVHRLGQNRDHTPPTREEFEAMEAAEFAAEYDW